MADLSIVLVNFNSAVLTGACIQSIRDSGTRRSYQIIVVDNASEDGSRAWLRDLEARHEDIRCVYNSENHGFGAANNSALPLCTGRYILFLNSDTLVLEPLDALVDAAERLAGRCGALGGRVLNEDRSIQLTCRQPVTLPVLIWPFTLAYAGIRPKWLRRNELEGWDHATERDVALVSGCYLLVPRAVLDEVGGFDPRFFLFYEETDLCYRIRDAGYLVRFVPVSTIIHLGGGSTRRSGLPFSVLDHNMRSARYFARKHLGRPTARILAGTVWASWLVMLCIFAPLALIMPISATRQRLIHRTQLLWHGLLAMPQHQVP